MLRTIISDCESSNSNFSSTELTDVMCAPLECYQFWEDQPECRENSLKVVQSLNHKQKKHVKENKRIGFYRFAAS